MAERRMFAKTIVLSDAFLDMSLGARCLYMTLSMVADDDGFVNSPKSIMRQCGASNDDMQLLIAKKFVIQFPDGVLVIKHWRVNNYLRSDRYNETQYVDQKSMLTLDDKGIYHVVDNSGIPLGIPTVSTVKDSIDKNSIDKDSVVKESEVQYKEYIVEIVDYLNHMCGTSYRADTKATQKLIKARLNEGYTVADFLTVIDKKANEWMKKKDMQKYLRPETLFGNKFESYLNQPMELSMRSEVDLW